MLKAEQVPPEVKRAMRAAWARRNNSDHPDKHMADLAVACINAWPRMEARPTLAPVLLILPLPAEARDGE